MPAPRPIPQPLLEGPFRTEDARALGVTRRQLQSGRFRHIFRDVWSSVEIPDTVAFRCRAARLVLPKSAVVCGVTAARLYNLPVPDQGGPVHVAFPPVTKTLPKIKGIQPHRRRWRQEHIWMPGDILVVRPEQLFIELGAELDRIGLIILGDAMLRHGWTSEAALAEAIAASPAVPGIRRARAALPHLEPKSDSPPETRLRMLLVDAGLPRPVAGVNISYSAGGHLAQVDLLYEEERIAIFYDGGHHDTDPAQIARDRSKDRDLALEGYLVLRYDKRRLFRFPQSIISEVTQALAQRHPKRPPARS